MLKIDHRVATASALAALMHLAPALAQAESCVKTRLVPFDTFMDHISSASIPLSIPVPMEYEHAKLEETAYQYSFWMPPKQVRSVLKTRDLPAATGYLYGKLSMDVGYDAEVDKFIGLEGNEAEFEEAGMTDLHLQRTTVNGHPIVFFEATLKQLDRKLYSMYVATNIETNAIYISYIPPENSVSVGDCYWKEFSEAVRNSAAK